MATVRVSTGFWPNKMLLSMYEGGRSVCVCVRGDGRAGRLPEGLKEDSQQKAGREGKKKKDCEDGRTHATESALLC